MVGITENFTELEMPLLKVAPTTFLLVSNSGLLFCRPCLCLAS